MLGTWIRRWSSKARSGFKVTLNQPFEVSRLNPHHPKKKGHFWITSRVYRESINTFPIFQLYLYPVIKKNLSNLNRFFRHLGFCKLLRCQEQYTAASWKIKGQRVRTIRTMLLSPAGASIGHEIFGVGINPQKRGFPEKWWGFPSISHPKSWSF